MKPSSLLASVNRCSLWHRPMQVWDFTLTPPTFDRWFYLGMHRLDRMGREEKAALSHWVQPGMQVADIGANLGLYSLLLARLVGASGRVLAFEPDPLMASALRLNLAANRVHHAEVFECAIGATTGQAVLHRNAMNAGANRLVARPGPVRPANQLSVPVRTLQDALPGRRLDFIKMDVEGWEGEAFRGLGRLLDDNPALRIYFEFWPHGLRRAGTEVAQFATTLRQLGLRVTRAELNPDDAPVDLVNLAARMAPKAYTNLLAFRA